MEKESIEKAKRSPLIIFTNDVGKSVLESNLMISIVELEEKANKEINDQFRKDLLLYQAHELRDILRQLKRKTNE